MFVPQLLLIQKLLLFQYCNPFFLFLLCFAVFFYLLFLLFDSFSNNGCSWNIKIGCAFQIYNSFSIFWWALTINGFYLNAIISSVSKLAFSWHLFHFLTLRLNLLLILSLTLTFHFFISHWRLGSAVLIGLHHIYNIESSAKSNLNTQKLASA